MKVLVDEMYDSLDDQLNESGFDAKSVKKLIEEGKKLRSDFSVITYAKDNGMILVTGDKENEKSCEENAVKCFYHDKDQTYDAVIKGLKEF